MVKNNALRKLKAGGPICGLVVNFGCPEIAEYAAHSGLDWVWLDWQHGSWTEGRLAEAISRFLATDSVPLVRVRGHQSWEINRVLDMGAMGVIVPMVNSREEAEMVVCSAKYTPLGHRSGGGTRLPLLSEGMDSADYMQHANEQIMVVVMVETVRAMENAGEILEVPGIDVVLVGPGDLLMDVRAAGGDVKERDRLVEGLLEKSRGKGTPVGYVCSDLDTARAYINRGFKFVSLGTDAALVRNGFRKIAEAVSEW